MADERYIIDLINRLENNMMQTSQYGHKTAIEADNGESMDLLTATNIENVKKSIDTWVTPELFTETATLTYDGLPPVPPKKPKPPPPPDPVVPPTVPPSPLIG